LKTLAKLERVYEWRAVKNWANSARDRVILGFLIGQKGKRWKEKDNRRKRNWLTSKLDGMELEDEKLRIREE